MIAGLVLVPCLASAGQATSTFQVSASVVYNCSMQTSGNRINFCTNNPTMPSKQKFEFESSAIVLVKDGYISVTY